MNCEQYDWKAYALGELTANERREAEAHAPTCEGCRGELAQVRLTIDTLSALREEEVPRRIAFVSDKVFEPRWWQTFLRPSFVLAAALVIGCGDCDARVSDASGGAVDEAEIQARVNQAVTRAVADVEQRNADLDRKVTTLYVATTGIIISMKKFRVTSPCCTFLRCRHLCGVSGYAARERKCIENRRGQPRRTV